MKTFLLMLMMFLLTFTVSAQDAPAPPEDIESRLDAMLNGYLNENTPAAALLVITPDWTYEKAVGVTELGGSEPVTPDMSFQIGSNTKMMTSAIILQLQEEGLLDVNDPISQYLPDIASRLPNGDEITILQMLKHRSGLWDFVNPLFYGALDNEADFGKDWTPDELIDYTVENGTPTFAPDSLNEAGAPNFSYSNTGYLLLGLIIEELTGSPLNEVYSERIFEPLNMQNTYYETGIAPAGTTPRGYLFYGGTLRDTTDFNLSGANAAGAVISTPRDMAVFVSSLLKGELFQDPATLELMLSDPTMSSPSGGDYALGIQDKSGEGEAGLWGHGGQTLAFESDAAYDVNTDITIIAWTSNAETAVPTAAHDVMRIIEGVPSTLKNRPFYLTSINQNEISTELTADESARYTITFNDADTIAIQADCNQGTATYGLGAANSITITLGVSTLVACTPDSYADSFLALLEDTTEMITIEGEADAVLLIMQAEDGVLFLNTTIASE